MPRINAYGSNPGGKCRFALSVASAALVCVLASAGARCQTRAAASQSDPALSDSTVYRVTARSYSLRVEDGVEVSYLDGGVRIDHQTAWITSRNGKDYRERKHTILTGDVHAHDGTMDIFGDIGEYFGLTNTLIVKDNVRMLDEGMEVVCERATYHRRDGVVILVGNVVLSDETRVMYADSIYYDRETEIADATGRVVLIDQVEEYSISGRHARFFRRTKEAVMDRDPVLTFDERAVEKGRVTSVTMHFNMETSAGSAVGEVNMVKGDTRATCDSAVIFNDEEYVELFGDPVAKSGSSGMSGEVAVLYYDDEGIRRVVLPRSGRLTDSPAPGSPWREDSWLEGDSLIIYMSNDEVDSVKVFGGARAMYYPYEGDETKVSNNYSRGDSMFFRFAGEDLSYVRISGKAEGVYNYIHLSASETIDSLAASIDTTLTYRPFLSNSERVRYRAKVIEYFAEVEDIVLRENAVLDYQNKSLKADHIDFNSRLNILEAEGSPVLEENRQEMFGAEMSYDMETEGGLVKGGSTQYETGYYQGEHIFKDGEEILKVYNSIYTTCDLKRAHYSMRAGKMKIYIGDKIVSGPITLYIGEIPIFYLPFLANSLRRDRHSGILRPNFDIGLNSRDGRFIRGLGYYWATNDYTDFLLTTDFNENQNFRVHLTNRYKVRYVLDGNAEFNYFRNFRSNSNEWTLKGRHSQKFGRTASLNADLSFVSSDQAQSSVFSAEDVQRVVDRRIYSTASFRKKWGGTSLSLSARRDQKLNLSEDNPYENRISMTIPSMTLNFPRTSAWFGEKHPASERGFWERMLRGITFSPNISSTVTTEESAARKRGKIKASSSASFGQQFKLMFLNVSPRIGVNWSYEDVLYDNINEGLVVEAGPAVITGQTIDTGVPVVIDGTNNTMLVRVNQSDDYTVSVAGRTCASMADFEALASDLSLELGSTGAPVQVLFIPADATTGFFSVVSEGAGTSVSLELLDTPGNIYGSIGFSGTEYSTGTARSGPVKDDSYTNEASVSLSTGIGTSLYGTFYPKLWILRGIRHTFNPTATYSYRPKLTKNQRSSQSVSYEIRNVLDLKYLKGGQEVKKNNALTWSMSGTYNPEAASEDRFSDIRSYMNTTLGSLMTLRLSHTIDPYEWEILTTNFSLSMNKDFSGSFSYSSGWKRREQEKIDAARGKEDETGGEDGDDRPRDEGETGQTGRGPADGSKHPSWDFRIGYSFSTNYGKNLSKTVSSKIDLTGTLNLTKGWMIRYAAYYDPEMRKFTNQQYSIFRDMHCWQASFIHRRFGNDWGYYFQIQIKDLPDIYHEVGRRGLRSAMPY